MHSFTHGNTHRHSVHTEQHTPELRHVAHSSNRIHALPPEIEMLRVKTYAAELTARINESLKILRNTSELASVRRTQLQLAKERFSTVKKLLQEHHCITASEEKLAAVEAEIFSYENSLKEKTLPGTSANPRDIIERVRYLVTHKSYAEAEKLLVFCIERMEDASGSFGTAPWYYEELCRIYRVQKEYGKEVKVLEAYLKREKAPGTRRGHLYDQLKEARRLVSSFGQRG